MQKNILAFLLLILSGIFGGGVVQGVQSAPIPVENIQQNPLAISEMRKKSYQGSDIVIEKTVSSGANFTEYIASYNSDGLKIHALLTVPRGSKPAGGWPVIVFNHGYIPPAQYNTVSSYARYVNVFANHGYIVFKPDYRGNGQSEGQPQQVYASTGYVDDDLNAIASIAKYPDANPQKIGIWAHSMGGNITLHDLVISHDIKAAVIWAGSVGSSDQLLAWWQKRIAAGILRGNDVEAANQFMSLVKQYGTPAQNPSYWNSVDPTQFLGDVTAPMQLHHEENDPVVPVDFSTSLKDRLTKAGKVVELHTYQGSDHNIGGNEFVPAMSASLTFFDHYLK